MKRKVTCSKKYSPFGSGTNQLSGENLFWASAEKETTKRNKKKKKRERE